MAEKATKPRKSRLPFFVAIIPLAMLGAGFAAKPLYDTFCRITGFGGTTKVAERASDRQIEREIIVRFDANTDPDLGWEFKPQQKQIKVKLGQNALAFYTAKNISDKAIIGTASYNVTPYKTASFFSKIDCFCFTEQRLEPGETAIMPVLFYIAPELADEPRMDEIKSIFLSYTFHKAKKISDDVITSNERAEHLRKTKELAKELAHELEQENLTDEKGRG